MIKKYTCKICKKSGTRKKIRKHIKEDHKIQCKQRTAIGDYIPSLITENCIAEEDHKQK